MTSRAKWIGLFVALAPACAASATVYSGPGGILPDAGIDKFGEDVPTTVSFDITVADSFQLGSVQVQLSELFHSWSGDLLVTLTHIPSATTMILVDRVGYPEKGAFGSSFPFEGTYQFADGAGAMLPSSSPLTPGAYAPEQPLSGFAGLGSMGTWRLSFTDFASEDEGSLAGWSLELQPVPGPLAWPLLIAGVAVRRRRR